MLDMVKYRRKRLPSRTYSGCKNSVGGLAFGTVTRLKRYIVDRIQEELAAGTIDNWHGVSASNIHEHLIEPVKETYMNEVDARPRELELWTVLHEDPQGRSGLRIVFGPDKGWFGLAQTMKHGKPLFMGYFGTFIETLNGM